MKKHRITRENGKFYVEEVTIREIASFADHTHAELFMASIGNAAPKPVKNEKPKGKASDLMMNLRPYFDRVRAGENLRAVADDLGMPWRQFRGHYAMAHSPRNPSRLYN